MNITTNEPQPEPFWGQAYLIIRIPIYIRGGIRNDSRIGMIVRRMKMAFRQTFKSLANAVDVGKAELWLSPDADSTVNAIYHLTTDDNG